MRLELRSTQQKHSPLEVFAANNTSQSGEDGIIGHLVKLLQPRHRYCVEFGAWDGRLYSNCFTLVTSRPLIGNPWRGLMIEANQDKFSELAAAYAGFPDVQTMKRFVWFEGPDKLDAILKEAGAPTEFGLLSIDVDGNDYHIWESLSHYHPEVVVIEINPTVPNDVCFVQDRSFNVNQGSSLLAMIELGKQKGYELVAAPLYNAIFVRQEKYPLVGIEDNSISALFTPVQDGRIFQGMDNTIHVVGMDRLIWGKGKAVSSEDFQIFPRSMRGFIDAQKHTPGSDPQADG